MKRPLGVLPIAGFIGFSAASAAAAAIAAATSEACAGHFIGSLV
jgi:hypothetical protein